MTTDAAIQKPVKPGYKKTPLGWIPEEWEINRLDQIFKFLSTSSFSRSQLNYTKDSGIAYIHYGDIHATYSEQTICVSERTDVPYLNSNIKLPKNPDFLKTGDLIVADASEDYKGVGACIEIILNQHEKALAGLHTFALRDIGNSTYPGFRGYLLKAPQVSIELKRQVTGSNVYGLSKANFIKFNVLLPPLPEQQKIATILSTWDTAIEKLQQLMAQKQQLKKGLMQQLLTGKKRFDGFERRWKEVKLQELFILSSGKTRPLDTTEKKIGMNLFPVYGGNGITGYSKYSNQTGQRILIGRVGEYCGSIHMVGGTYWVTDNCLYIKDISSRVVISFLAVYLGFLKLSRLRNKGGQPLVSQKPILNLKVMLPEYTEQQKIAKVLSTADKEIENLEQQLEKYKAQKKGLLQKLLTGEVRVKV